MREQPRAERPEVAVAEAHQRLDKLIEKYVQENNHHLQGWGSVEAKPALRNPDRLRQILHRYLDRRVAQGLDPQPTFGIEYYLAELAAQETVFEDDFDILDSSDPDVNCAMYALKELGFDSGLKPSSTSTDVRRFIETHFVKASRLEHGDMILIEDGGEDGWHIAVIEKRDDHISFRSKLGQLFVVRNENLKDLLRLYRANKVTIYKRQS